MTSLSNKYPSPILSLISLAISWLAETYLIKNGGYGQFMRNKISSVKPVTEDKLNQTALNKWSLTWNRRQIKPNRLK